MDPSNKCQICHKQFSTSFSLKRHEKNVHKAKNVKFQTKSQQKCPICNLEVGITSKELQTHLENTHKIPMKKKLLTFKSTEEFLNWKKKEEKETNSMYVKHWSSWTTKTFTCTIYYCHRSGNYKTRGNGKRHTKSLGSNKINSLCPAQMKVKKSSDGRVQVDFARTHVGHAIEMRRMQLTETEKKIIADKISKSIPLSTILDEIRNSVCGDLQRIHFVNRRDLLNIANKYGLNRGNAKYMHSIASLNDFAKQMSGENSPIAFYKPLNSTIDDVLIEKDDFILVIMNDIQKDQLLSHGNKLICIDSQRGLIDLTTILVLDEANEGFPVVFALSNRTDEVTMEFIFNKIKEIGIELEVDVLMTDVNKIHFDAWTRVFGEPKSHLYCEWDVDEDWQKNLSGLIDTSSRAEVYETLGNLVTATDEVEFERKLTETVAFLLTDPDTATFGKYFCENYSQNGVKWARCFRSVDTTGNLKETHEIIRNNYLEGKKAKEIGKGIYTLLKFVVEKKFDRIVALNGDEVVSVSQDRHLRSLDFDMEDVVVAGNCWIVQSHTANGVTNTVEKRTSCVESCPMTCSACNFCIHRFSCTCVDYCIKSNMCEHIHLVCRKIVELEASESRKELEEDGFDGQIDCVQDEVEVLIPRSEQVQCLLGDFNREVLECEDVEDEQFVVSVIKEAMMKLKAGKKC